MGKKLGISCAGFVAVLIGAFFLHTNFLTNSGSQLPFPLQDIYIFNTVFSLVLCFVLAALNRTQKFADQLGFLYLASVVLKALVFLIVFNPYLFNGESFTNSEAVSLLIPLFLSLIFEVFFISRLLSEKRVAKNEE